ncbi:MAG: hypothetical protein GX620_06415 [Chloroflexi bacterium]|nr:hypothetical protein [Chloroflexota bacterium]
MMNAEDLVRLQDLDSEYTAIKRRLQEIQPLLGESGVIQRMRKQLQFLELTLHSQTVRQRDLELEMQGLADKITSTDDRLYSGAVRNPKELADLQAEAAALRRRRQVLEDSLLEAMIAVEESEASRDQIQHGIAEAEREWAASQADLLAEQGALQAQLNALVDERASLLPSIDAATLSLYEALRKRKGGVAVAVANHETCGLCGVTIAPGAVWKLRQGELVTCSNCERIIVRI